MVMCMHLIDFCNFNFCMQVLDTKISMVCAFEHLQGPSKVFDWYMVVYHLFHNWVAHIKNPRTLFSSIKE